MSAADYAKLVGVSPQTIYNWEKGKTRPRKEQIARLSLLSVGLGNGRHSGDWSYSGKKGDEASRMLAAASDCTIMAAKIEPNWKDE